MERVRQTLTFKLVIERVLTQHASSVSGFDGFAASFAANRRCRRLRRSSSRCRS